MAKRILGTSVGLSAIGAALLAAASGPSWGSVVVYDNSAGTFWWYSGVRPLGDPETPGSFLDITQPATQSGERRTGTMGKWFYPNNSSSSPGLRVLDGEREVQTARTTEIKHLFWKDHYIHVKPTRDYLEGELVASSDNWDGQSTYFWHLPWDATFDVGTPGIGTDAYLGVRVKMADNQWHYGWIHYLDYMTPIAWAYETEPNTPIQIPVPSPSASLYLVMMGLGLRSRHR
ncbi:MAG: hypothetical protein IT435_09385 [Phycisphaerales bacterium]|nr:hypothetical protein [Phycisphaerales bacterium]